MENISAEKVKEILLKGNISFLSTQQKLSIPIINRIHKKMIYGIKFIIDGHHRYISSLIANHELDKIPTLKSQATKAYEWKDVDFVSEEWDTNERIHRLNEIDAAFNNIPIEKIIEIIK